MLYSFLHSEIDLYNGAQIAPSLTTTHPSLHKTNCIAFYSSHLHHHYLV